MTNRKLIVICVWALLGLFALISIFLFVQSLRDKRVEDKRRDQMIAEFLQDKGFVPAPVEEDPEYVGPSALGPDVKYFEPKQTIRDTSTVVGYIANGAFVVHLPFWMSDNWYSRSEVLEEPGSNMTTYYPSGDYDDHDFTKIRITTKPSHETFNAYTLYEEELSLYKDSITLYEMIMNEKQDMRIYHIEKSDEDNFDDTYYLDGKGKTAIIEFSSSKYHNYYYSPKVKEFVRSFVSG